MSADKLRNVADRLGLKLSEDEALSLINIADEDENGEIGLGEFEKIMCTQVDVEDVKDELQQTFDVFDKDGNGTITCTELGTLIKEFDGNLNEVETKEMIKIADINSSGTIEIDEFLRILIDDNSSSTDHQ